MFANWEIITHIYQTLHAHVPSVYLRCISKDTNTGDKVIAHPGLEMSGQPKDETKFILHSDYTKIFFVFTGNSLQTNQAQMSMQQWLL